MWVIAIDAKIFGYIIFIKVIINHYQSLIIGLTKKCCEQYYGNYLLQKRKMLTKVNDIINRKYLNQS